MGRGHREGFCKTLHSAPRSPEVASFLLQDGMSQPPPPRHSSKDSFFRVTYWIPSKLPRGQNLSLHPQWL